ncbi:unnamed protein product [Tuber aestivum]|uniref:Uncharacterized protein n=1 Tax=Tuber aestivum TaxID=59557 RepID=A0A292Q7Z3_9PEZI|nr:unnamed protein product [Tuber aestivum]
MTQNNSKLESTGDNLRGTQGKSRPFDMARIPGALDDRAWGIYPRRNLSSHIKSLNFQIWAREGQISHLQCQIGPLENDIKQSESKIELPQFQLEELRSLIQQNQGDIGKFRGQSSDLHAQVAQQYNRISDLYCRLAQLHCQIAQFRSQIAELHGKIVIADGLVAEGKATVDPVSLEMEFLRRKAYHVDPAANGVRYCSPEPFIPSGSQ